MPRASQAGFTLMELLIVMAILAIVAAMAVPNLLAAKANANETAAIATLRNLVSAQAQVAVTGKVDADRDGKGEFATFLELTGTVGVRSGYIPASGTGPAGSDFSSTGEKLNPAILSATMAHVNGEGFVVKAGYAFKILLPDSGGGSGSAAGFAFERGPATAIAIGGGTGKIGVDLAETFWCAYAQPLAWGTTGTRRFFSYQRGDVMQSGNDVARGAGVAAGSLDPASAFRGNGITAAIAVAATGADGDVWKVAN